MYGYALAAHKKSVHEKSRDFACDLCEYATHNRQVRNLKLIFVPSVTNNDNFYPFFRS